jgi:UDPglucose 6-dehydrogenase
LLNPDRILIGGDNTVGGQKARQALVDLYSNWVSTDKILTTNVWSSELSKLTANAFLAQRISSINAMSELCEKTGADVNEVAKAVGMDSRIGAKFLKASVGFGGSCFQKDILNLVYIAKSYGLHEVADYWEQVIVMNDHQKRRFSNKIVHTLYNTVADKKITFLGWAFKKDTNDTRESAAIYVADDLINEQAQIAVYDPKVTAKKMLADLDYLETRTTEKNRDYLSSFTDPYEACSNAHAIAVLTEWDDFRQYDWQKIYDSMQKPAFVFDGRNLLDCSQMESIGFVYQAIGS